MRAAPQSSQAGAPTRAMILAAGLGTRLKPWTDAHPKALVPVNGKSLLQRNIEYLQQFGIFDVLVNVHHFADQIIDLINTNSGWGSNISISDERDEVLETGGGLQKGRWFLKDVENFVLLNVDVLTDLPLNEMINAHCETKALATLATTKRTTSRFFLFNDLNNLCGWRNIKTGEEKISTESLSDRKRNFQEKAFSGIHVVNTKIFSLITQEGKFSMVDVYLSLAAQYSIKPFDHSNYRFIDVGKPESIREAEVMFD
jgi:NDP-sugar pyrophosphorylase family protein